MKTSLTFLRVQSGVIEDNNMSYANAFVLGDFLFDIEEKNRCEFGRQVAKIKIDTSHDKHLVDSIVEVMRGSQLPVEIPVEVTHMIKKGEAVLSIVGLA